MLSVLIKNAPTLGLCFLLGCGSSVKLYKVDGAVTLDQKPLPNVIITFAPVGEGSSGAGTTDSEGKYTVGSSLGSGLREGKYKVHISEITVVEKSDSAAYEGGSNSADYEKMASAGSAGDYKNAGKKKSKILDIYDAATILTADVTPSNTKFNFELKSK